MEENLILLEKLQDIDLLIDEINNKKERYPKDIEKLDLKLGEENKKIEVERERLKKLDKDRRRKEGEIQIETERIKNLESKLYEVKTNKEYESILKEIAEGKRMNMEREDEILTILDESDVLKKEIEDKEKNFNSLKEEFERKKIELKEEFTKATNELEKKINIRNDLLKEIDSSLINKYNIIRERRGGLAVVPVKNGICQGCHINIPPQMFNEIRKNGDIKNCPSCSRFLYWNGNQSK